MDRGEYYSELEDKCSKNFLINFGVFDKATPIGATKFEIFQYKTFFLNILQDRQAFDCIKAMDIAKLKKILERGQLDTYVQPYVVHLERNDFIIRHPGKYIELIKKNRGAGAKNEVFKIQEDSIGSGRAALEYAVSSIRALQDERVVSVYSKMVRKLRYDSIKKDEDPEYDDLPTELPCGMIWKSHACDRDDDDELDLPVQQGHYDLDVADGVETGDWKKIIKHIVQYGSTFRLPAKQVWSKDTYWTGKDLQGVKVAVKDGKATFGDKAINGEIAPGPECTELVLKIAQFIDDNGGIKDEVIDTIAPPPAWIPDVHNYNSPPKNYNHSILAQDVTRKIVDCISVGRTALQQALATMTNDIWALSLFSSERNNVSNISKNIRNDLAKTQEGRLFSDVVQESAKKISDYFRTDSGRQFLNSPTRMAKVETLYGEDGKITNSVCKLLALQVLVQNVAGHYENVTMVDDRSDFTFGPYIDPKTRVRATEPRAPIRMEDF